MPDQVARQELETRIVEFGEAWARGDVEVLRGLRQPPTRIPMSAGMCSAVTRGLTMRVVALALIRRSALPTCQRDLLAT